MADRFIQSHIKLIPMFQNLTDQQLEWVGNAFEAQQYNAGEWIFVQGYPTKGLFMFVHGYGLLVHQDANGEQKQLGVIQPDQYLNREALFADGTESASLYAHEPSTVLFLSRTNFLNIVANHPELKTTFGLQGRTEHHTSDVHFKAQRENEDVLLLTRRHWWAFARSAWLPFIVMIALWVVGLLVSSLAVPIIGLSFVVGGLIILYFFLEWRNDSILVTTQRIIRITRTIHTFQTNISEVPLDNIHEVNIELPAHDVFARAFNYASIEIRTPGDAANLRLEMIQKPEAMQKLILEDKANYQRQMNQKERNTMRADIDRWIDGQSPTPTNSSPTPTQNTTNSGFPLSTKIEHADGSVTYRKHRIIWFRQVFAPLLFTIGMVTLFILAFFLPRLQELGVIIEVGAVVGFIVGVLWFYWSDWDWRNDQYIVQDDTIVMIRKRPLWLQNNRDQILLNQIDNVVAESKGLFQQMFTYGDVRISLIGADRYKIFDNVDNPLEIQADISRRLSVLRQRESNKVAGEQKQIIGEYISEYHQQLQNKQQNQYPVYDNLPAQDTQPQVSQQPTQPISTNQNPESNVYQHTHEPTRTDRNRPPGIPQKRTYISEGKPYTPAKTQSDNPRPPRIPRKGSGE